jgi:hypothetical protein
MRRISGDYKHPNSKIIPSVHPAKEKALKRLISIRPRNQTISIQSIFFSKVLQNCLRDCFNYLCGKFNRFIEWKKRNQYLDTLVVEWD